MIAIAVLTYNRVHLLRQCLENTLARTSPATQEIVIWNNASSDGTREYLDGIDDPRITVINHPENICNNGFIRAFELTTAPYLVTLGDDIIEAPDRWDETLLDAYNRLPNVGFLASDFVDDEHDECARLRYRVRPHLYTLYEENGVGLLRGPSGSGCALTSRELYDRVGGFREHPKGKFWQEDTAYVAAIEKFGYERAVLADLKVHHAGGPYYTRPSQAKLEFSEALLRRTLRKNAVKRGLLRIPFVRSLNETRGWFRPPEMWWEDHLRSEVEGYRTALASAADDPRWGNVDVVASPDR